MAESSDAGEGDSSSSSSFPPPSSSFSPESKRETEGDELDVFDLGAVSRSIPEGAMGEFFSPSEWEPKLTRAFPSGAAPLAVDSLDKEFHALPINKSIMTADRPSYRAPDLFFSSPTMHAPAQPSLTAATGGGNSLSALHPKAAAQSSLFAASTAMFSAAAPEPPVLPPAPYFLTDSHFDVSSCTCSDLMDAVAAALAEADVSITRSNEKHKFKCYFYSAEGNTEFRVKVYRRTTATPTVFIVESQHRRGSTDCHRAIYRQLVASMQTGMSVQVTGKAPITQSASRSLPVPKELAGEDAVMEAADVQPLADMLATEYDDVCQQASRTLAAMCAAREGVDGSEALASDAISQGLVDVLQHADRSVQAQAPAAAALVYITSSDAGQLAVLKAGGLQPLLKHAGVSHSTPEARAQSWHLRRDCLRVLSNLCTSSNSSISSELRSSDVTRDTLMAIVGSKALTESSALHELAQGALNGIMA